MGLILSKGRIFSLKKYLCSVCGGGGQKSSGSWSTKVLHNNLFRGFVIQVIIIWR